MDSITKVARSSSVVSGPAQTHTIQVGLADHKFVPNVTEAAVGDTLEFRFYPLNHSVVRAEYLVPCIPYEMSGPSKTGFFGGFHAVDKVLEDAPSYSILVNDTNPIFFYCSAPGSCLNYGMVGAVNPNNSQDIEQQHQKAKDSAYMLNPGDPFPAEGTSGTGNITGSTGVGNGGGTVGDTNAGRQHGLSKGAIAGIAVGGIAMVVLAALLFFFWGRTKSLEDEVDRKAGTVRRVSSGQGRGMVQSSNTTHNNLTPTHGLATSTTPTIPGTPSPLANMLQHQHHQYSSYHHAPAPAPTYYTPATNHDHHHNAKFDTASPAGHPAYPLPLPSPPQHPQYQHHPDPRTVSPLHHHPPNPNNNPTSPDLKHLPSYFETMHRPRPLHLNGQMGPAEMEARSSSSSSSSSSTGADVGREG